MTEFTVDFLKNQGVEPATGGSGFRVLEAGDYNVMITSAEETDTKSGGKALAVEFSVIDGDFSSCSFKQWFNLENKNQVAQDIGRSEVLAMLTVTNVNSVDDLDNRNLRVRVSKDSNEYRDKNTGQLRKGFNNNVKKFMDTKGRDAKGNEVPAFVATPSAIKKDVPVFDSSPSSNNIDDDEINF